MNCGTWITCHLGNETGNKQTPYPKEGKNKLEQNVNLNDHQIQLKYQHQKVWRL